MSTLPLVSSHDLLDVVLHDTHQRCIVVDLAYPIRQLAVPHQSVTTQLLVILRGEVGNLIGIAPAELTATGLSSIPFHGIFGRNGTKLGALDQVLLGVVRADRERSANIRTTLRNDGGIKCGGLAGFETVRWNGRDAAGKCQRSCQTVEQHRDCYEENACIVRAQS